MNHPALLALLTAAGCYVAWLWRRDVRAGQSGTPHPNGLPGATPAPPRAVALAIMGALGLLAVETAGEHLLGLTAQQSRMTWLFGLYSVTAAPMMEEIVFRGWLVLGGSRARTWLGAAAASLGFALLHPFLWRWDDAGFAFTLTAKGSFSTTIVFATSLWLYVCRLAAWNPRRSLLPCFAGHAAKNAGVVAIKAATGFMGALF